MRMSLLVLSAMLLFALVANAQHQCYKCSRDRQQQCYSAQYSGTCTPCSVFGGVCTEGTGTCLNICLSQASAVGTSGADGTDASRRDEATRQPWLFDKSLGDQISVYSQSFARIVKGHQMLYTGERKSALPIHGSGTFFATDDPDEQAGTFEFFRNGQHWVYTIDKPLDPARGITVESPNRLELTGTTWGLFRDDGQKHSKLAEGSASDQM
jgi:hypothetical protein